MRGGWESASRREGPSIKKTDDELQRRPTCVIVPQKKENLITQKRVMLDIKAGVSKQLKKINCVKCVFEIVSYKLEMTPEYVNFKKLILKIYLSLINFRSQKQL